MLALEVIPIGVGDIDRSLKFYVDKVGFALDVDYRPEPDFRVVQITPPGSACSIHLVKATGTSRLEGLYLVTADLVAERERLIARGVDVGPIRHKSPWETWAGGWAQGLDPQRRDYSSFADFVDPDGNSWTLQERGFRGN